MFYKRIKDFKYKTLVFTLIGIVLVLLIWSLVSLFASNSLFPGPLETFSRFGELFIQGSTYEAIGGTLLRLIISLTISFLLALALGILAGINKGFYDILNPLIIVLRTLPVAAVIFVLIVLLKPTYALFIITGLTMFPIMFEAIANGIRNVDPGIKDSMRIDASLISFKNLFVILLPSAKEDIILGVIQSLGLGMKVSLMAEVLVGTDAIKGLGRMLYHGYIELDMRTVLASALYAIILIGLIDIALKYLKKHFDK